jgi:putative phage-type endonuclease
MNVGKFKPRNQDELLMLKRGELQIPRTKAMAHGNRYEAQARAWIEENTGQILEPVSLCREIDGLIFWASLDGATMDLDYQAEIKCPMKGDESELWQYVAQHLKPPPHYYWQMVHQWMASQVKESYFVVYDSRQNTALSIEVRFSAEDDKALHQGWKTFWERYYSGETVDPPRDDEDWLNAAARWRLAKETLNAAQSEEAEAREALILLAGENGCHGAGVKASRYEARGRVVYEDIPALQGMDLGPYRKESSYRWRLDVD